MARSAVVPAMLTLLALLAPACRDSPTQSGDLQAEEEPDYRIFFARRTFVPPADIDEFLEADRTHGLLQLQELPKTLDAIESLGIQVHGVQHNNGYYVTLPEGVTREELRGIGTRALFSMQPLDRISPRLVPIGADQAPEQGELRVVLDFVEATPLDMVMGALQESGATPLEIDHLRGHATIQIPSPSLLLLAREPWLWWMDVAPGPFVPDLDVVTERLGADVVQPPPWGDAPLATGLTGSGVTVGLWEIPIGQSAAGVLDSHPDLLGRVAFGPDQMTLPSPHATQVAGVLAGDGTASAQEGGDPFGWSGVAPLAHLVSWDAIDSPAEMVTSLALFDTTITSHSFGLIIDSPTECGGAGAYDMTGTSYDDVVRSSNIAAFVSPGNNAELISTFGCTINVWDDGAFAPLAPEVVDAGFGSVTALGVAKNPIAVGGRRKSSPPGVAAYSGRGPTADGRLKPDVVAISGDDETPITMPSTPELYAADLGVSFAVPQATGAAALLLEHYRQDDPTVTPLPAIYKAVLANTAADVGAPGPDYTNGHGLIQIPQALAAADSFMIVSIEQGDEELISLGVDLPEACGLRIMAAWSDPPSMGPSMMQLINDIDLSVFFGAQEVLPWVLTPSNPLNLATRGVDSLNNVEQVTLDAPAGDEIIRLVGTDVPMGPQDVVVHWYAVPCDLEGADGTGFDDGGGGGGASCSCTAEDRPRATLPYLLVVVAGARRRRPRAPPRSPRFCSAPPVPTGRWSAR